METGHRKLFLDTAPFIYLLDHDVRYVARMKRFFDEALLRNARFITSAVTVAEYLVQPYRRQASEQVKRFFAFLDDTDIQVVQIGTEIAERAAAIRAAYPAFKAMDLM